MILTLPKAQAMLKT